MKTLIIYLLVLIVLISLTMFLPDARAKDFPLDLSFTPSASYDAATEKSGVLVNPTGRVRSEWVGAQYNFQVKLNTVKFQPTFEFGYRHEDMSFSNWQQHALIHPDVYNILVGTTYTESKTGISAYLLTGYSFYRFHATLYEVVPGVVTSIDKCGKVINTPVLKGVIHGSDIGVSDNPIAIKVGLYKTWDVPLFGVTKVKVGPEVSLMIYPNPPSIERCRNVTMNYLVPNAGIRIQW